MYQEVGKPFKCDRHDKILVDNVTADGGCQHGEEGTSSEELPPVDCPLTYFGNMLLLAVWYRGAPSTMGGIIPM